MEKFKLSSGRSDPPRGKGEESRLVGQLCGLAGGGGTDRILTVDDHVSWGRGTVGWGSGGGGLWSGGGDDSLETLEVHTVFEPGVGGDLHLGPPVNPVDAVGDDPTGGLSLPGLPVDLQVRGHLDPVQIDPSTLHRGTAGPHELPHHAALTGGSEAGIINEVNLANKYIGYYIPYYHTTALPVNPGNMPASHLQGGQVLQGGQDQLQEVRGGVGGRRKPCGRGASEPKLTRENKQGKQGILLSGNKPGDGVEAVAGHLAGQLVDGLGHLVHLGPLLTDSGLEEGNSLLLKRGQIGLKVRLPAAQGHDLLTLLGQRVRVQGDLADNFVEGGLHAPEGGLEDPDDAAILVLHLSEVGLALVTGARHLER